mmetsp:Transcript_53742/g.125626  ORF Transcript_53742/g.125626 Transcript_53742/m.125626 type:complete len:288 (-) Transcript_53742:677-1540(-)
MLLAGALYLLLLLRHHRRHHLDETADSEARSFEVVELEGEGLGALSHRLQPLLLPLCNHLYKLLARLLKLFVARHSGVGHLRVPFQLVLQRLDHRVRGIKVLDLKLADRSAPLLVLELLLSVEPLEALGPGLGLVGGEGGRDEGLEVHPHVDAALEEDGLLRAQRAIQRVPLLRVRVVLALQRRAALGHRAVVQRQVPRRLPLLPPPARLLVARYLRPPQPRHHVRVRPPVVDHDLVLLRRLDFKVASDLALVLVCDVEQYDPQALELVLDERCALHLELLCLLLEL